MSRRFRQTMKGSSFGDFVCNQVIPARHCLMKLGKTSNWEPLTAEIVESYEGKPGGGGIWLQFARRSW
jgi:hypothetical protein